MHRGLAQQMETKVGTARPQVGLVIGAGGLKGVAVIGLLRVLAREGIAINLLAGSSAGALYAAVIASGKTPDEIEQLSYDLWPGKFERKNVRGILRALLARFFPFDERTSLVDDSVINRAMYELFGDKTFADCGIPLYLTATDLHTGDKVILSQGRLRDAVRASIGIPLLLPPWDVNGRLLVDGGASDPLPIDIAIREGCETIIAMGFTGKLAEPIPSLASLLDQTSSIIVRNLLKSQYAFYNMTHDAEIIPLLVNFDRPIGLGDTHLIPYLIEQGAKAAEKQLPYLKRLLAAPTH